MKKNLESEKARDQAGIWESLRELLLGVRRPLDCLQVEVTSCCPGRCGYCPHTIMRDRWMSRDMDMETFGLLWPLMRRSGRVHLQGWGEPLIHPRFFDMVSQARKAGCSVSTTTCGLPMDEEMAKNLVESGLDILAFSLAGTDSRTNASRRGVDFERVCRAVSLLQAVRKSRMAVHLEVHFAYLMLASNLEAVRGLPKLMQNLGVHAAVISTLDFLAGPEWQDEGFALHETEKLGRASVILKETEAEARRLGLGFHWALPNPWATGRTCRENIARSVFVGVDGSISPCVYLNLPISSPDPNRRVFGNVRDEDPLGVLEKQDFRRFRDVLAAGSPDSACRDCVKRFET